jgi:REP element-mobilizing transposase RayT
MDKEASNSGLERVRHSLRVSGVSKTPPNPLRSGIHSRGYLPHVKREGAWYFVTFRLVDSLPRDVLLRFQHEQSEARRRLPSNISRAQKLKLDRELQRKIERHLDQGTGACHLRKPAIAELVVEALHHYHGQQYLLDDWVIMPNHVHVILWPMPNFTLSDILMSRKRHTSRQAHRIRGTTGTSFWQRESYDNWIRDDEEKLRIRLYIRMNPVKAGLCKEPEDWRWSSAWPGWKERQSPECP